VAQRWYQKASVQTALVTGLFLIAVTTVPHALRVPKLKDKIDDLKHKLEDKSHESLRLETQLAPFRALALEKYPGDQAEALKKLAEEVTTIRGRLERAERSINRFQARVKMSISANWSASRPSDSVAAILPGLHPSLMFNSSKTGGLPEVVLFSTESRATEAPADELGIAYVAEPKAGAPPLGMPVDDLAAYTTASISLPFVTLSTVTDGKATLRRFELEIPVNGTRRFFISENPNYSFDVPTEARKIRMLDLTLGKAFWSTHKIAIE
jgi:hypothetical protein